MVAGRAMSITMNLVQQVHELGACLRLEGERVIVEGPSPLPSDLMTQLRALKAEVRSYLKAQEHDDSWFDLPFPLGYEGLPRAQAEAAEIVNDKFGIKDPLHRKYNVLSWIRGYYQDRGENSGEHYEAIKQEQLRLGQILDRGVDPE
jgi:hypothetical protein